MENMDGFSSYFSCVPLTDKPMLSFAASASSSSSSSAVSLDDAVDDACSICLEPFSTDDPSTVTGCKHEYHLQCILEWLQRSKECPICWQPVVLKDAASQELLAAVESERLLRSRNRFPAASTNVAHLSEDCLVEQDSYSDDSDVDEHVLQHLAAFASRARSLCRREMQRSPGHGPSEVLVFNSPERVQLTRTSPEAGHSLNYGSLEGNSPDSVRPSVNSQCLPSSMVTSIMNTVSGTSVDRDGPLKPRFLFAQSPTDTGDSEISSLSESIKSKWSVASARYKESIARNTRGIKEKLLARNNSVKELSRGVQREVSAGIAGVARMIERLDLAPKRAGSSSPVSGFTGGNTKFFTKGKEVQGTISPSPDRENNGITQNMSLDASARIFCTVPESAEVNHITYSVPFALASIFSNTSGAGQGLSLGVLNLSIVVPQMIVSVVSGPWDALFGGGNLPAFVVGAIAAAVSGVLALTFLPSPSPDATSSKTSMAAAAAFH